MRISDWSSDVCSSDLYDTELDEDASNISAGEKQLITIARAFLARPSVLILDEATSSVDTRTELLLQHAMAALRQGRTRSDERRVGKECHSTGRCRWSRYISQKKTEQHSTTMDT